MHNLKEKSYIAVQGVQILYIYHGYQHNGYNKTIVFFIVIFIFNEDKSVQSIIDFFVFSGKYQIIVHFTSNDLALLSSLEGNSSLSVSASLLYRFPMFFFQFGKQ